MRGQAGVFARQYAAGVRHKLAEQIDVLIVQSIHREIDLRLGARRADFHRSALCSAALAPSSAVGIGLTWHKFLSDFAVQSVAAQEAIVLHQLDFFGLELFVACGKISRRRFAFFASFRAFEGNNFSRHKLFFFLRRLFFGLFLFFNFWARSAIDGA